MEKVGEKMRGETDDSRLRMPLRTWQTVPCFVDDGCVHYSSLRSLATGIFNCSRYLATVLRAIL